MRALSGTVNMGSSQALGIILRRVFNRQLSFLPIIVFGVGAN